MGWEGQLLGVGDLFWGSGELGFGSIRLSLASGAVRWVWFGLSDSAVASVPRVCWEHHESGVRTARRAEAV